MAKIRLASWISLFATLSGFSGNAFALQWGEVNELQEFVSRENQAVVTNARLLESGRLMEAGLSESPWSGDFWPDQKGSIADPYNETGQGIFGASRIMWTSNHDFLKKRAATLHQVLAQNVNAIDEEKWDNLSPSEKYDMLMGDTGFTMTHRVVEMVEKMDSIGLVAGFSGVCHGWGPASLYMPRPEHTITLMSPLGRKINFYPFDIKALASFLWGKSAVANMVKFEGSKCYSGAHKTKYGRLVDSKCFNINPATFHLVAVNQIGLNHRGFIVDRKSDATVWNHPVYGYRAKFFKVSDRHPEVGVSLDRAKVSATSLSFDPFREFRSAKTVAIVGVEMTFYYGKENRSPDHIQYDGPSKDVVDHDTLRYDLELDAQDNIIGGEWREFGEADAQTLVEQVGYTHPNSIWLAPVGLNAFSPGDIYIQPSDWNGNGPVPASWRDAAVKYASVATIGADDPKTGALVSIPNPQALGPVVDRMIEMSRRK